MFYRSDTIVPERIVLSSWATNTLSMDDSLALKHQNIFNSTATSPVPGNSNINTMVITDRNKTVTASLVGNDSNSDTIHYPMPITVLFNPKQNQKYCSRFRFSCEFANTFDLVLQGEGTYEESEHQPLNPVPRG
jgi:hypothetical protein